MSRCYDPEAAGALCHKCPLKGNTVVPPSDITKLSSLRRLAGEVIAVVGGAPGEAEEKAGTPFAGGVGAELNRAFRGAGIRRDELHVTNALLCSVPGGKLKEFLAKIKRENKERLRVYKAKVKEAAKNDEPAPEEPELIASPIDCCAPRLERELTMVRKYITLGNAGLQAVMKGSNVTTMGVRGSLIELDATEFSPARKVVATLHPSLVQKMPRWAHVFRGDIAKAAKWFRGEIAWVPPNIVYQPSPSALRSFLASTEKLYIFDIETDGIESLTANIRCIAIGHENDVMVMSFKPSRGTYLTSHDNSLHKYDPATEYEVRELLKAFFEDETKMKVGHNAGYYDKIVLQQQWKIEPKPIIDTMLLHRCVESELPHSLGYVVSVYTHAPSWKCDREGNKLATASETDKELAEYCAYDVALTARVTAPLISHVGLRQQTGVWRTDQKMQEVCVAMHTAGMFVDQKKRHEEEVRLLARRHELLTEIRDRLSIPDFNPGSIYQMRDILFDKWQLVPPLEDEDRLTSSGDPSTADLVLRSLLTDRSVEDHQRALIKLVRYYRKIQKVLGTYVVKLRPEDMLLESDLGWDDDEDWVDKETRKRYGLEKRGIVNPETGRMYPGYNSHVTVTGRLSSSKPLNAQNFPKALRSLVVAQPGNVLVGADMDQLELRIAAARWRVALYLKAFQGGKDPHSMTAFSVFGDRFCAAAGITPDQFERPGPLVGTAYIDGKFEGDGEAKKMRDLSKAVQYASQYMAKVETVHKLICKTEIPSKEDDGTTDLPYAQLPLKRVRQMRDNWLKGAPEFEKGWYEEIETYRDKGYLSEDIHGRRRDFLDGEMPNEIVNFPIQCVPGHVRVITSRGYIPIRELQGQRFTAWTGKRWAPATCISKGKAQLRKVTTRHALDLMCDATHKMRVPMRSAYEWKEVDDLLTNQRVAIDLARELEFGTPLDPLDAYVLGFYVADGCLSRKAAGRNRGVTLTFAVGDEAKTGRPERCGDIAIEKILAWGKSHGLSGRTEKRAGHTDVIFDKNAQYWCRVWDLNPGLKTRDKRIPEVIWRSDLAARRQFMLGLLDGDGYQTPDGAAILNMFNPDLLKEVAVLARTVGVDALSMRGPYKTNADTETVSWHLVLAGAHVHQFLGWGRSCKYRSNNTIPQFECTRIVDQLKPQTASHRTMRSRIRGHAGAKSITPYSAVAMGVSDIYDHAVVNAVHVLDLEEEVFTLCVEDEDHQYVANGFISKNSSAAALMNNALIQVYEQIPLHKWGPGTGIINQCHDSIVVECPEDKAQEVAQILERAMNQKHPSLPGVEITATAAIGKTWKEVG